MLIQFTIENHRSIRESAVISFAASKDKSLEEYLMPLDTKGHVLPTPAMKGLVGTISFRSWVVCG